MQQRGRDDDLLPHPFRVRGDALIRGARQAEQLQKPVDLHRQQLIGYVAQPADQLEVLASRQERVEIRFLRHVAELMTEGDQIVAHVAAVVFDASRRGIDEPRHHAQRRRLAGSVWSEVADDFTGTQGEVDVP